MGSSVFALAQPELMGYRQFFAMNTQIRVFATTPDAPELLGAAEHVFHTVEQRFSRFLPSSELSRLNDRSGDAVELLLKDKNEPVPAPKEFIVKVTVAV